MLKTQESLLVSSLSRNDVGFLFAPGVCFIC
jgi:hypothetical protein